MANFEDKNKEQLAAAERYLSDKANTLGKDANLISEPFVRSDKVPHSDIMTQTPSANEGLLAPNYDDYPTEGAIGTRYPTVRLLSYLPSGLTGPNSVQTFMAITGAPATNNPIDIESVRLKPLISPKFSQGKANAAHGDPNFRGFELALYPAKSTGGIGFALEADTTNGPISILADPGAGPPADIAPGMGNDGFWTVDYNNGIVRFSRAPLNGSSGVMNPNNVYGNIEGAEVSDAYGAITMFATFYHYTGDYGTSSNLGFVTVGDGYVSEGIFNGVGQNTLQAAIDSVAAQGGTVFVKPGNYTYDGFAEIPVNVSVIGLNGVVITKAAEDPAFVITGSNSVLDNFHITSVGSNAKPVIQLSTDDPNTTLENVVIKNIRLDVDADSYGIGFLPEYTNTLYKNITIEKNIFSPINARATYIGLVYPETDGYASFEKINIFDNDFGGGGFNSVAIQFTGSQISKFNDCGILRNHAYTNSSIILGSPTAVFEHFTIADNNMAFSDLMFHGLELAASHISDSQFGRVTLHHDGNFFGGLFDINIDNNIIHDQFDMGGRISAASISSNTMLESTTNIYGSAWVREDYPYYGQHYAITEGNGTWLVVGGDDDVYVGDTFLASTDNADTWHRRKSSSFISNSSITFHKIRSIEYGNNIWVAGTDAGTIRVSSDANNWTHTFQSPWGVFGVVYDGYSMWNTVGGSGGAAGVIHWSTDAINWNTASNIPAVTVNAVDYDASTGLRVAVGGSGGTAGIFTSDDGINWTNKVSPLATTFNDVTSNGVGYWAAVGNSGGVITSDNGIDWVTRTTGISNALRGVAYGNGIWVAVGAAGSIVTSTDGITWTYNITFPFLVTSENFRGIHFENGQFVMVSEINIYTSVDGATWARAENKFTCNAPIYDVEYDGNGTWVSVGHIETLGAPYIAYSKNNGKDWTRSILPGVTSAGSGLRGVDYGNGVWLAAGDTNVLGTPGVATSTDGVTWNWLSEIGLPPLEKIHYDGYSMWTAVGSSGVIRNSTDNGASWTSATSGVTSTLRDIHYANGLRVAVGDIDIGTGVILTSPDGTVWTRRTTGLAVNVNGVTYSHVHGLWVAGTSSGTIFTSTDGEVWTNTADIGDPINHIKANDNGEFVAVGAGNSGGNKPEIYYSTNGITWQTRYVPLPSHNAKLSRISYGAGRWMSVGSHDTTGPAIIMSSMTPQFDYTLNNVAIEGNELLALKMPLGSTNNSVNINDNDLHLELEIGGQLSKSNINNNRVGSSKDLSQGASVRFGGMDRCNVSNNVFEADTFATLLGTSGFVISGSTFSNNKIVPQLTESLTANISLNFQDSIFEDSYIQGAFTFASPRVNSVIRGNRITGSLTLTSDSDNCLIADNIITGTFSSGDFDSSLFNNNTTAGATFGLIANSALNENRMSSWVSGAVLSCILADNKIFSSWTSGEIFDSILSSNTILGSFSPGSANVSKTQMLNNIITGNMLWTGSVFDSMFSNNTLGNAAAGAGWTISKTFVNNIVSGNRIASFTTNDIFDQVLYTNNYTENFTGNNLIQRSVFSDGYYTNIFNVLNASGGNDTAAMKDCTISGNWFGGQLFINSSHATALTVDNVNISNNIVQSSIDIAPSSSVVGNITKLVIASNSVVSAINLGNTGLPPSTVSCTDVSVTDNKVGVAGSSGDFVIGGQIVDSKITGNSIGFTFTLDYADGVDISSNTLRNVVTDYMTNCVFSGNKVSGTVAFGNTGSSSTIDITAITNNVFEDDITFAETSGGCYAVILSNNTSQGIFVMCSDWNRCVISNNTVDGSGGLAAIEIGTAVNNGAVTETVIANNQAEFGFFSHSQFDEVVFCGNRISSFEIEIDAAASLSRCADQSAFIGNWIENEMVFDFNRTTSSAVINQCTISSNSIEFSGIDISTLGANAIALSTISSNACNGGLIITSTSTGDTVSRCNISSNSFFGAMTINHTGTSGSVLFDSVIGNNSITSGNMDLGLGVTGTETITVLNGCSVIGNRISGGNLSISVSGRDETTATTVNSTISDNFMSGNMNVYGATNETSIVGNTFTSLAFHILTETLFSNNNLDGNVTSLVDDGYGILADSIFTNNVVAGSMTLTTNAGSSSTNHQTVIVRSGFTNNDIEGPVRFVAQTTNQYASALDQALIQGNRFGGEVQMQIRGSGTVLAPLEDITVINSMIDDNIFMGELRILVLKDDGFGLDTFHTCIMAGSTLRNNIIMSNVWITNMGGSVSASAIDNCIISGNIIGNETTNPNVGPFTFGSANLFINHNLNPASPGTVVTDLILTDNRIYGDIIIGNNAGFSFTNGDVSNSIISNNNLLHSDSNFGRISMGDLSVVTISGNVFNNLDFDTFAQTTITGNVIFSSLSATSSAGVQLNSITGNYIFDVAFSSVPTGTWFVGNRFSAFAASSFSSNVIIGNRLDTGIDGASLSTCTVIGNIMGAFLNLTSVSTSTIIGNTATNFAISNSSGATILMNDTIVIGNRFSSAFSITHTATGTGATMSESLIALNVFNGTLTLGSTGASFDHAFVKSGFIGNYGAGGITLRTNVDTNLTGLIIAGNAMAAFTYSNTALTNLTSPSTTGSVDFYLAFNFFSSFTRVTFTANIAWISSNVKAPGAAPTGGAGTNASI